MSTFTDSTGRLYYTNASTATIAYNADPKDEVIRQLKEQIEEQQRQLEQLQAELKNTQTRNDFSEKEIRLLINKCHPDKNNGSQMCAQITDKLLNIKKSSF